MIFMGAKSLDDNVVAECKRIVDELIRSKSRGNGDTENAMRRLANRYGLSWRVFWNLRYRNPSDVLVGVYRKLQAAHRAECGRQLKRIEHELELAKAGGVFVEDLQDKVSALAAQLADCVAHGRQE